MARKGYIQLVNGFYMNRKVRKLRHTCPSAIGAFTMMLTFCGDNLSDGHISEDDALYVLDITDSELEALCNVGMIEPDGNNGYYIHDYLIHNRSREQVQKKRESNAENYRKNKNEVKTSDSDDFQTAESRLNRDKHQNTRMNYLKIIQLPLPPQSLTSMDCSTVLSVFTRRTGSTGRHLRLECSWRSNGPRS